MIESKHNTEKAIILALLAFFAFTISDSTRKLLALDYPIIDILFWQAVFAFVVLVLASPFLGGMKSIFHKKTLYWQWLRALLIAANTSLSILAVSSIPLMDAYTIFFLTPFVTTILSMIFFGERFGIYRWMAIICGFLGGFIAFRPGFAELHPAYLYALTCVFTFSFSLIIARKIGQGRGALGFGLWPIACLLLGILCFTQGMIPPMHDTYFLFAGFISGTSYALALMLISTSYTLAPASVVAPFQYVQIIFAISIGYLLFKDIPDPFKLLGSGIIIGSGVFLFLRERTVKKRLSAELQSDKTNITGVIDK